MTTKSMAIVGFTALVAASFGCSQDSSKDTSKCNQVGSLNTTGDEATQAVKQAKVVVVNRGEAPYAPLRYNWKSGVEQAIIVDIEANQMAETEKFTLPDIALPPIRIQGSMKSEKANETDKHTQLTFTIKSIEVFSDPQLPQTAINALKQELKKTQGFKIVATMTQQSIASKVVFEIPEGATPRTVAVLDQAMNVFRLLNIPLPAEPVGVGAKWDFYIPINSSSESFTEKRSYELYALEGKVASIRAVVDRAGGEMQVTMPGVDDNVTVVVQGIEGHGLGQATLVLDNIAPKASYTMSTKRVLAISNGKDEESVATMTNTYVRFQPTN